MCTVKRAYEKTETVSSKNVNTYSKCFSLRNKWVKNCSLTVQNVKVIFLMMSLLLTNIYHWAENNRRASPKRQLRGNIEYSFVLKLNIMCDDCNGILLCSLSMR